MNIISLTSKTAKLKFPFLCLLFPFLILLHFFIQFVPPLAGVSRSQFHSVKVIASNPITILVLFYSFKVPQFHNEAHCLKPSSHLSPFLLFQDLHPKPSKTIIIII